MPAEPVPLPHRRVIVTVESATALAGLAGAVMLATGTATPPLSALEPLGLETWLLPAAWLFLTVPVPATVAAVLTARGSARATAAVLLASAALAVEVLVQVPFVGGNGMQPFFAGIAALLAALALDARRRTGRAWAVPVS